MRGNDVSSLQTFLATDNTIYPQGLVTGYFGGLTKSAVSNFQVRNGLPGVGRVGPATLPVINAQMNAGMNTGGATVGGRSASISNVSVAINGRIPTVTWNTDELTKGVVYYSSTPLTAYERENAVDINGASIMTDANFRGSQSVSIPNLASNTTYYYMLYTTDQDGNVSVTTQKTFQTSN
ncbi:MAG: peptidoglycan-binding protein [Candidatus Pacebacteria bacterium]|nr:peptidoglycan-binding protein [Candidatus Paceibacterota bacterium]MBP9818573.1 peptidoglycan-binding protein [Candidatus Paceibacterota bacterium]